MGVDIHVGVLSRLDPAGRGNRDRAFAAVNRALIRAGHPTHTEPGQLPELTRQSVVDGFPAGFQHRLRRFYAYYVADPDGGPPSTPARWSWAATTRWCTPNTIERVAWPALFDAARLSVAHRTAIWFS